MDTGAPGIVSKIYSFVPVKDKVYAVDLGSFRNNQREYDCYRYSPSHRAKFELAVTLVQPTGDGPQEIQLSDKEGYARADGAWVQTYQYVHLVATNMGLPL